MSGRRFTFIGVTTGGSSIMRLFPRWRDVLGLGSDVEMAGRDIPVAAPVGEYRRAVEDLRDDPENLGALVTTHKIDLLSAARDLFDELDENARLCGEISCISKRDGKLVGSAKDPVSSARALEGMLAPDHFGAGGGEVLCLGAGGSGVAITLYLAARRADRPERVVVTDTSTDRLERLGAMLDQVGVADRVRLETSDGTAVNERLLATMPGRSLVINATGMGKDIPGSPLGDGADFPTGSVVWELNYRGDLDFLVQARRRAASDRLTVVDGWDYFIHGWTAVMEEVFAHPISAAELDLLTREAEPFRPTPERPR